MAILNTMDEVNSRTRLLPVEICKAVIERIDREAPKTDLGVAHEFALRLLGCYPNLKAHDPKAYTASLVAVFASYPPSIGKRVADPVRGLGAKLKYDPKVADLTEALEAEVKRRGIIRGNALWHMQERESRLKLAEAEKEFEGRRLSPEARKAQVEKLIGATVHQWPAERPTDRSSLIDRDALFEAHDKDMAELQAKRAARA